MPLVLPDPVTSCYLWLLLRLFPGLPCNNHFSDMDYFLREHTTAQLCSQSTSSQSASDMQVVDQLNATMGFDNDGVDYLNFWGPTMLWRWLALTGADSR